MAKVLTFSRYFPAYHPRKGEETFFVEKIWENSFIEPVNTYCLKIEILNSQRHEYSPKLHTIRSGNRWKVGDKFSPRVWSGKPYNSKQIIIANDIEVKKIFEFNINTERNSEMPNDISNFIYINGKLLMSTHWEVLACNDGLNVEDMCDWFKIKFEDGYRQNSFTGQIICWSDKIDY